MHPNAAFRHGDRALLETPSPSGFEQRIQQVVRERMRPFADEVRTDTHGNVFAARFPEGRPADAPRIMLAGHCDQIGLLVQYIDGEGFIYSQTIGGWSTVKIPRPKVRRLPKPC